MSPQTTTSQQAAAMQTTKRTSLDEVVAATRSKRQTITSTAAAFLGVEPARVCDLLRGVWTTTKGTPPLSNQELTNGLALIARYELDPFAREIYVTRDKRGRLITIIGIDGWIRILDRTDHYDGFEQLFGYDQSGNVDWVETRIYSKHRRHPAVYRAFAREYKKLGGYVADLIPDHMLRLFSLRHAARLFVPLGGNVLTEEEARWMQQAAAETVEDAAPPANLDNLADQLTSEQIDTAPAPPPPADQPEKPKRGRPKKKQTPPPPEPEAPPAEISDAEESLVMEYKAALEGTSRADDVKKLDGKFQADIRLGPAARELVAGYIRAAQDRLKT